jgi:hypothetical protein
MNKPSTTDWQLHSGDEDRTWLFRSVYYFADPKFDKHSRVDVSLKE